ncbi:MAG: glycosyltransferase family 4 protein [Candidatus Levybacteria bacterium]|nr:glycosyltransferase family 4 protein [Candidatus Levybacteria bacterium]
MKIAIDISPLSSGHKVRGVGFYLEHLKNSIVKYDKENEYVFFVPGEKLPEDIDLIHFPYFEPFFLALPLYKKHKTIVTVHDLTPIVFPDAFPRGIKGEVKWQMQRLALKKTNGIITDSKCSKNDVIKFVGTRESKVDVVYLAAGEEFKVLQQSERDVDSLRKKYNLPDKFALYVGDVTWNKNLPRLIDAIQTTDIPLVMIGKSLVNEDYDKENPWNHDLVRVHELTENDKNILRLGFVDTKDLVAIYNLATLFVMPSLYEGFGLPILEAMSCGCPVITTKEGSLGEVAGEAAYFVDGYNLESIANGINKVFTNSSLQDDLKNKGFDNIKKFSWEKTSRKTVEAYRKAIGK